MGSRTDADIRAWQKHAGLKPATGQRRVDLEEISRLAFELIKVIELEISGIRDGDGHWCGSWPLGGAVHDINVAFNALYPDHLADAKETTPATEFDAV